MFCFLSLKPQPSCHFFSTLIPSLAYHETQTNLTSKLLSMTKLTQYTSVIEENLGQLNQIDNRNSLLLANRLIRVARLESIKPETSSDTLITQFFSSFLPRLISLPNQKPLLALLKNHIPEEFLLRHRQFFVEILDHFFLTSPEINYPSSPELIEILENYLRLYYLDAKETEARVPKEETIRKIYGVLRKDLKKLPMNSKVFLINFMKFARIIDDEILDYVIQYVSSNMPHMSLDNLLSVLTCAITHQSLPPHELIYKSKPLLRSFRENITSSQALGFLHVLSRVRCYFWETVKEDLINTIQNNEGTLTRFEQLRLLLVLSKESSEFSFLEFKDEVICTLQNQLPDMSLIETNIFTSSLVALKWKDPALFSRILEKMDQLKPTEDPEQLIYNEYLRKLCEGFSKSEDPKH